jgi:protein O-GlcNAc transferase
VQDTDVLVGVHGAGLTHILFLSTAAVVVEILPANVNYEGFRNLARLQGVRYLRRHGQIVPQGTDWHAADILLPEEDFEDLMGIAVDLATERFASPAHVEDSL